MIGTIVNTCTIIAGSLLGSLLNRGIKEKYKEVLYTGLGLASLAIISFLHSVPRNSTRMPVCTS